VDRNNVSNLNIKLVLGLGDIVDNGSSLVQCRMRTTRSAARWPRALHAGHRNHDYDNNVPSTRSAVYYNTYYGVSHYAGQPWFRGSFPWAVPTILRGVQYRRGDYLVMMLEFYPRNSAIAWARHHSGQCGQERDHRQPTATSSMTIPHQGLRFRQFGLLWHTGDNDGEEMWNKLAGEYPMS